MQESEAEDELVPAAVLWDNALFGLAVIRDRRIVRANERLAELFGYGLGELLDETTEHLYPDRSAYEEVGRVQYQLIRQTGQVRFERTMRRKDGSLFWCRFEGRAVAPARLEQGTVWTLNDQTKERASLERALLHTGLFEKSAQGILITDASGSIVAVNRAFTHITGYTETEMLGKNPRVLQSGRHERDFYQNMWAALKETGQWQGEVWNRRKDGRLYPELLQIIAIRNEQEEILNFVGFFSDLSGAKEVEQNLARLSQEDSLTGLPRRDPLLAILRSRLTDLEKDERLAIVALDLNQFKRFNEAHGLTVGDKLLRAVADRIKSSIKERDFAARLDGDDFVVLTQVTEPEGLDRHVHNIVQALSEPYDLEAGVFHVQISAGISLAPDDGTGAETLLRYAGLAQNRGRKSNRNSIEFFRHEMNADSKLRIDLEHGLRVALERDQFTVHYQPQLDTRRKQIVGVEALVRWDHPEQGLLAPGSFIPAAENCGLVSAVNRAVLRLAGHEAARWIERGFQFGRIAVNCSGADLSDREFVRNTTAVLHEAGLPANLLTIEITETMAIENIQRAVSSLNELRALGVRIAMDDFGTGYASINALRSIPLDYIKLDRSFVKDLPDSPEAVALTRTILAMAEVLGYDVIAEGVETQGQQECLDSMGCFVQQGYLHARPTDAQAITESLQ